MGLFLSENTSHNIWNPDTTKTRYNPPIIQTLWKQTGVYNPDIRKTRVGCLDILEIDGFTDYENKRPVVWAPWKSMVLQTTKTNDQTSTS